MQKKSLIFTFLIIFFLNRFLVAQTNQTAISGTIFDAATGEVVIGAYIYSTNAKYATITNAQGHFTLWINNNNFDNIFRVQ